MTTRYLTSEESSKEDALVYSGLLGVNVVGVFSILTISTLDIPLRISLYSFAIGIPLLALNVYALVCEARYKWTAIPPYLDFANFGGPTVSVIGLVAIFWHFSWVLSIIFIVTSAAAFIFMRRFTALLESLNEK